MRNLLKFIPVSLMCVSIMSSGNVSAQIIPSFTDTATMAFFQGFDLETGTVDEGLKSLLPQEGDAENIIRLVIVDQVVDPENTGGVPEENTLYDFDFNPTVDFQLGIDSENYVLEFNPQGGTVVAMLQNQTFASVTELNTDNVVMKNEMVFVPITPNVTLIAGTREGYFFKIGNFRISGSNVSFDYAEFALEYITIPPDAPGFDDIAPEIPAVPEPSMLVLYGIGLGWILNVFRRKVK